MIQYYAIIAYMFELHKYILSAFEQIDKTYQATSRGK